jgi:hypothetical protein
MSTLTDRYVWDVTRRLPASRRDDIERELRSTIADMAEAADERTALVELGDPARLAAEYRSGGRALIGDDLYPEYVRQLRRWLTIVVPVLVVITGVGAAFAADATVGSVVVSALGGAVTAVFQVCFWVTGVFAVLERYGGGEALVEGRDWDPDDLPEVPEAPQVTIGETVADLVLTFILVSLLFVQRWWSPLSGADGEPVPVLDPDLWSGPIWAVIGLLLAGAAVVVVVHVRGSWTWPLAALAAAIDVALLALVARSAFSERLVNPTFLAELTEEVGRDTMLQPNPLIITVIAAAVLLTDAGEALVKAARRSPRAVARVTG